MRLTLEDGRSVEFAADPAGVRVRVDAPGIAAVSCVISPGMIHDAERAFADAILEFEEHAAR